ncbi:hypothetical protein ABZ366_30040, partial [Streptomyces sp. NPDC005904]
YEERRRIAVELRGEVARHAGGVIARAEAGDIEGVAQEARAGLSAMRELLGTLRAAAAPVDVREPHRPDHPPPGSRTAPGAPKEATPSAP